MISSPARPEPGCGADRGEDDEPAFAPEQVAIQYIDEQLHKARRSLRRTRVFCIIFVFMVLGYMSVVTITIRNRLLRPDAAAEMAVYYITRFAAQNGWAPSANVGEPSRGSVAPVSGSHATKPSGNPERPATETIPSANTDPRAMQAEVDAYVRYVAQKLATLTQLESQFDRLAHANDLTPYEKTLRHILASTMSSVREGT